MNFASSFEKAYESMDRVHFPAGIRGIAPMGAATAFSFFLLIVLFNEYFLS
jgi:hypothetical protein